MDANEQRARELLADQYEAARLYETADGLRAGLEIDEHGKLALRAIRQALAQQVPADGEWVLVAIEAVRNAELFEDGIEADLSGAGITTLAEAAQAGRMAALDELQDELRERRAATPQAPPTEQSSAECPVCAAWGAPCASCAREAGGNPYAHEQQAPQPVVGGQEALSVFDALVGAVTGFDPARQTQPMTKAREFFAAASQPQQGAVACYRMSGPDGEVGQWHSYKEPLPTLKTGWQWEYAYAAPTIGQQAVAEQRTPRNFGGKTKPLALCPASCGCLWVNNGDGSMSLFSVNSKSCDECETLPWDQLLPVCFGQQAVDDVRKLPAKWRGEADSFGNTCSNEDRGYSNAQFHLADELDAALAAHGKGDPGAAR